MTVEGWARAGLTDLRPRYAGDTLLPNKGITGLVDRQAQKVLNGISSKDNA